MHVTLEIENAPEVLHRLRNLGARLAMQPDSELQRFMRERLARREFAGIGFHGAEVVQLGRDVRERTGAATRGERVAIILLSDVELAFVVAQLAKCVENAAAQ